MTDKTLKRILLTTGYTTQTDKDAVYHYIKQLQEVIEEVREHIEKNLSFCENDSQSAYEVCNIRIASDRKLLQLLDKVKGE